MPDITQPMSLATSTPKEAAENITNSNLFDIGADVFKDYKTELMPEVEQMRAPAEVPTQVANYVSKSPEHAALAKPDLDSGKLTTIEKQFYAIKDAVGSKRTKTQELSDLNLKKMFKPDEFGEDEELQIFKLNEELKSFPNYGLEGFWENVPAQVAGELVNTVTGFGRNKELIATSTAIGAGIGLGSSLFAGPAAPLAAGPTTLAGAGTGFTRGLVISMAIDGANRQMGSTFNDLTNMTNDDGTPLDIDHDTKKYLAASVGIVSGVVDGIIGQGVAKSSPLLGKFIDKKKFVKDILTNASSKPLLSALTRVGKTIIEGGVGETFDETVQILTEELAKTYTPDKGLELSDANFANAMMNSQERLASAFVVGGLTTGAMSGALNIPEILSSRKQKFQPSDLIVKSDIIGDGKNPVEKATQVLKFEDSITAISEISKSTEMKNLSPNELSKMRQNMAKEAGVEKVWIDKEDMQKFASNPEKASALRAADILDDSGTAAASINAPTTIDTHKFLDLVDQYPDIKELAKLRPEDPNAAQARKLLEDFNAAETNRAEILEKLKVPDLKPEERAELEERLKVVDKSNDIFGEEDYLNQPTMSEAMVQLLPEGEVIKLNDTQRLVREVISDNIQETARYEMDAIKDIATEQAVQTQYEIERDRIANDPNVAIVDKFTNFEQTPNATKALYPTERYPKGTLASELTASHSKPGFSPLAIDPRTLPDNLKKYADNEQLKKNKVFVQGGINVNEAARLVGVNNGKTLLKLLANTKSRKDIVAEGVARREADIKARVDESVDLNQTSLIKAYGDNTANHITEMKILKETNWSTVKKTIRRIALPLPKFAEISIKAKDAVKKTIVGNLNVNQFKVGERKSNRIAVDAVMKNEIEKAFVNKEHAALNSELAKETHIAIGQVNRVFKLAKRFDTPEVMNEMKQAGKKYEKAANEILDSFNLSVRRKDTAEAGAFRKYLTKALSEGEAVVEIPERLSDVRASAKDMSVEQVLAVGNALKGLLHQAKMKNRLYTKFEKIRELQTIESISQKVNKELSQHPDFDPKRLTLTQADSLTLGEKLGQKLRDAVSYLERAQHIILKLDSDKVNGLMNELLYQPIKNGASRVSELSIKTRNQLQTIVDTFGKDDWTKLNREVVQVPEFENIKSLKEGKITKGQLFKMMLNLGNEGNVEALERFGTNKDTIITVLERHLDEKHMVAAQQIWDTFKSFEPEIKSLQEKTAGDEVKFVEAKPIVFKGREYPGGYFPIQYQGDNVRITAKKLVGVGKLQSFENFQQSFHAEAMTDQGHLEARTGSKEVLNLSLDGIGHGLQRIVHDLGMRIPVRDTAKLLSFESIRNDIVSVGGVDGYNNIANMVIDSGEFETGVKQTDNIMMAFLNHMSSGFQSVAILGKLTSIGVQPASLAYAIDKMGAVSGTKYMAQAAAKIASNPTSFKDFYAFAAEIHPAIKNSREDLEGDLSNAIQKILPKKTAGGTNPNAATKTVDILVAGRDLVTNLGFGALGAVDQMNKVLVVSAAYMQALDGNAKGVEAGNHTEAAKYASNIAELTQTHSEMRNLSPIQKNKWTKWMTFFYNDANNVFNSILAASRKAKTSFKQTGDAVMEADYKRASKAAAGGVGGVMSFMLTMTAAKMYENIIRGQWTPLSDDGEDEDKYLANSTKFFFDSSKDVALGTLPLVRDINFAADREKLYGNKPVEVAQPYVKMLNDFKGTYTGVSELMDFTENSREVSKKEWRSMLSAFGYLTKTPTDAVFNYFIKPDYSEADVYVKGEYEKLSDKIQKFLTKFGGDQADAQEIPPELLQQLEESEIPEIPQEMIQQLEQIQMEITPDAAPGSVTIPPETLDVIKKIESNGDWSAQNPNSTAAGLYQFTESTWKDLMDRAPELGLTENGRVSADTEQQETAMRYFTEQNIERLERNGLEATIDNIYAAHFLGAGGAVQVLSSDDSEKLRSIVGDNVMRANSFRRTMTVKNFKRWLNRKTSSATQAIQDDNNASVDLTSN